MELHTMPDGTKVQIQFGGDILLLFHHGRQVYANELNILPHGPLILGPDKQPFHAAALTDFTVVCPVWKDAETLDYPIDFTTKVKTWLRDVLKLKFRAKFLVGFSAGGGKALNEYKLMNSQGQYEFDAIACVAPGYRNEVNRIDMDNPNTPLKYHADDFPTRIYHAKNDDKVAIGKSDYEVKIMRKFGLDPVYTVTSGWGHAINAHVFDPLWADNVYGWLRKFVPKEEPLPELRDVTFKIDPKTQMLKITDSKGDQYGIETIKFPTA